MIVLSSILEFKFKKITKIYALLIIAKIHEKEPLILLLELGVNLFPNIFIFLTSLKGPLAKEDSNSQQRMRAMTWDALRYLPTCEAMSTHRRSEDYS